METIDFPKLTKMQCALLDASSLSALADNFDWLDGAIDSEFMLHHLLERTKRDIAFRTALNIVERMVAYDYLVVDKFAANIVQHDIPETGLILQTDVPTPIYHKVADETRKLEGLIEEIEKRMEKRDGMWDGNYKAHLDEICQQVKDSGLGYIANSNLSFVRTLFYLLVSKQLRVPVFLHPGKDRLFGYFDEIKSQTLDKIKSIADAEVDRGLRLIYKSSLDQSIPSLARYVMVQAYRNRISIIQAVRDTRNKPDAREFRTWLWEIQSSLSQDKPDWNKVSKTISRFHEVTRKWGQSLDFGEGTRHKTISLKIGLPSEILGVHVQGLESQLSFRDPFLFRPLYLTFISSWYEDTLDYLFTSTSGDQGLR